MHLLADVGYQSNWTEVLQAGFMRNAFIGGTLEQLILSNITMLFDAEEAFMADWIAKHH